MTEQERKVCMAEEEGRRGKEKVKEKSETRYNSSESLDGVSVERHDRRNEEQ